VLESNLGDFPGALVLVTHDRFLLDRLSKAILAMDGAGGVEFFAELAQWEQANASKKAPPKVTGRDGREAAATAPKKKLTYLESREWEQIEERVAQAEVVLEEKRQQLERADIVSDPSALIRAAAEIDAAQEIVDQLYARWAELETKRT
jgi:ABC transport system ATP-binding/permease protein